MTKADIVKSIIKETRLSQYESAVALNAILANIMLALKNDHKVTLPGFGTFSVTSKKAISHRRRSANGAFMVKTPKFTAGKAFKEAVKELHRL